MITKNRKLIRRENLGKVAEYIDLDRLKADAEAAMLEIDDEAWFTSPNPASSVDYLFDWEDTAQGQHLWSLVAMCFTVEPLPIYTIRLAEIDGEIARLTAERERLATDEENV